MPPPVVNTPYHSLPPSQDVRTPSPNYFSFAIDSTKDCFASSAAQHARANWSPPSSVVRSTAALSPRIVPLDQNPEFDAFRKQTAEHSRFKLGKLSTTDAQKARSSSLVSPTRSIPAITRSQPVGELASPKHENHSRKSSVDADSVQRRSPKRLLSADSSAFTDRPRRNSPASFTDRDVSDGVNSRLPSEDTHPRFSLPQTDKKASNISQSQRAETLPASLAPSGEEIVLVTPQHVVGLMQSSMEEILLLDLRVFNQYTQSHICGALNLCIPTTLLKRPSFNVQKLSENFKDSEQREKFGKWRNSKYIIVYDNDLKQLKDKDAATCINTLKKFILEGWTGASYVIRGGFKEFSKNFSSLITNGSEDACAKATSQLRSVGQGPAAAPVIGGCPMPATKNAANPFFGNIRQNMDLIGGVGQMPIKRPNGMWTQLEAELPIWLRTAADESNKGKDVSDKFLRIEKKEQKRMQEALSGSVTYGTPGPHATKAVQIAGIEKGSKNRYNSIWPYEHTRVKIQGVGKGECDYVNASHISSPWSNKHYIATQGPLPTTFADFWNVVWQQDVRVIVMLTAEKEGGQLKAHNYWKPEQYGHLQLNFLSEHRASLEPARIHKHRESSTVGRRRATTTVSGNSSGSSQKAPSPSELASPGAEKPYVVVRKFTLSDVTKPFERMREITQLQYSNWPDFGAPAHPAHLLGLVEQCDSVVRSTQHGTSQDEPEPPNSRPVLVHCSAGCGRTGTFCTVDSVIDSLKRQRLQEKINKGSFMDIDKSPSAGQDSSSIQKDTEDLIEKTVEEFRRQRLSMVQSLRQFVLCYESVLEWWVEQHPKTA
ncbi:hypothetical protein M501DRAFT_943056 [Patellaria atrata CBS 101060]|uniref:protein-tyrosine-phosphatase n=1 Tax=Patellaria atrata CBS 101060 TaxID=1346257 RepID=A0A9P4S283_9PEZI|nr:hypothetical protein M501DRAFT_943056 [Patellaria atrata CBS 101060]